MIEFEGKFLSVGAFSLSEHMHACIWTVLTPTPTKKNVIPTKYTIMILDEEINLK